MKIFILVNPELQELCKNEVKELIGVDTIIVGQVLELDVSSSQLSVLIEKCQSCRRILIALEDVSNQFESRKTLKMVVENVKGQENRLEIAKDEATKLFAKLDGLTLDLKKPDYQVVVWKEDQFYVGIDQAGEMNVREYRVFPHSATFRGDFNYFIVRFSDYSKGKLLVGYCKDGSIAIETARFGGTVLGFDPSRQNITAARKNATIAGVSIDFQKYELEELDTRFDKGEFDQVIFHITKKDEQHLNELYYQIKYILKSDGIAVFVTRPTWDLSISDAFELVEKKELAIGQSSHMLWKFRKK